MQTPQTHIGLPLDEETDRVLVRFNFTREAQIPKGIRGHLQERPSDEVTDQRHQINALRRGDSKELVRVGRLRPGRVDTGTPVIDNLEFASGEFVRRGLAPNGFGLTAVYCEERPSKGGRVRYIVTCVYIRDAAVTDLTRSLEEDLRALSGMTWNFTHVWDNPDRSGTVNFVGPQESRTPAFNIVARDGVLTYVKA